jgi:hypothetical protein
MSALKDLQLTESQMAAVKDKLDEWKLSEKKRLETDLTEKYEMLEAQLKDQYEDLVANVQESMKQVYSKRFKKALAEMYSEIKAQVMMEHLQSPEVKAMEEIKATVYPFIGESTARRHRDEFKKLAEMYTESNKDLSKLKGEVKKAKLVESLSPDIRKVVTKLLGEGTETEIVERFATIKQALKEEKVMAPSAPVVESKTRVSAQEESADINEDIYDETDFIQPTVRDDVYEPVTVSETREEKEFAAQLQEQLVLSGLRKK